MFFFYKFNKKYKLTVFCEYNYYTFEIDTWLNFENEVHLIFATLQINKLFNIKKIIKNYEAQ